MVPDRKKRRARGVDKDKQFDEILEVGKELFIKKGSLGMRALARKLNMTEANLYNYVESKRELWIALRIKAYNQYQKLIESLEKQRTDSFLDFCLKWAESFFKFAAEDYARFRIMQFLSAPALGIDKKTGRPKEIGPFEKEYQPFRFIEQGLEIVNKKAIEFGVKINNPTELFYYIYSISIGAAKAEADLRLSQLVLKKDKAEMVYEPILLNSETLNPESFRAYVMKEIEDKLKKEIKE